jgi:hypothetical protein
VWPFRALGPKDSCGELARGAHAGATEPTGRASASTTIAAGSMVAVGQELEVGGYGELREQKVRAPSSGSSRLRPDGEFKTCKPQVLQGLQAIHPTLGLLPKSIGCVANQFAVDRSPFLLSARVQTTLPWAEGSFPKTLSKPVDFGSPPSIDASCAASPSKEKASCRCPLSVTSCRDACRNRGCP